MRVILFILGLLFSADGLYFASTTSMGVGEAFTVAIGIMFILWSTFYDAFKTKGFLPMNSVPSFSVFKVLYSVSTV